MISSRLSALLSLAALASAKLVNVNLDIANKNIAPDGFSRSTILANGQYPGPLIKATVGDTIRVNMNNKLTDPTMRRSTTMDFDGVFIDETNSYMEGTPFVTTCPVAPGNSYTYNIPLIRRQSGTFWYHSQLSVQYLDGFRGPLIVYDPLDPHRALYDVDDDSTIVQLGDWWHNASLGLLASYEATGIIPVADSATYNGKGRYNGGPAVPFGVTPVTKGKRHRLRILNESVRGVFNFSIDNHDLTVIESDGVEVQPQTVKFIEILAGQRYSVIVNANQAVGNYWINTPYVGGLPSRNPNFNITMSRGILRYAGAPAVDPTTPMTLGPADGGLVEATLRPLVNAVPNAGRAADINMTFVLVVTAGRAQWNINGVSYLPPTTPTLLKVLNGASARGDFNETENTFVLPPNKVVDIEFPPNDDDDAHPIHLHGNNFWVIKSSSSPDVNLINPPRRDVAGAASTGMTLRFDTSNIGSWFLHCHIFWHMQAGLATVQLMDPAGIRSTVKPNNAWEALCPAYNALPDDQK